MKTTRRMRAASLLAVAALGLSACGTVEELTGGSDQENSSEDNQNENEDNGDDSDNGDSDNGDDSDSGDDDNRDDDNGDDSDNGDDDNGDDDNDDDSNGDQANQASESLTSPGAQLKVGDTATVPQGKDGATVMVTVSKITKGSFSDLSHLEDADQYKDYTPVYVEYTVKGTNSSSSLEHRLIDGFRPILTDGRRAGSLVIVGTQKFEKCDPNSMPKGFGPGDTVTDCDIAMLADGQEIGGAEFRPFEGDYADSGKIVWKQ